MRWRWIVAGVVVGLVGLVWTLQGLNVIKGSFMTDQSFWAGAGVVALVAGVVITYLGARRRAPKGKP